MSQPPPRDPAVDPPAFEPLPVERTERLYDSPWVGLRRDLLALPDGSRQDYHVVEITDAVVIVPRLADGRLLMIWQHRHPHGGTHWELPAGRVGPDERPERAAAREVLEETGHRPGRLEELPGFYAVNGISAHWSHVFVAHDCESVCEPALEPLERLQVHAQDEHTVREWLRAGRIPDAFSAMALFHALRC